MVEVALTEKWAIVDHVTGDGAVIGSRMSDEVVKSSGGRVTGGCNACNGGVGVWGKVKVIECEHVVRIENFRDRFDTRGIVGV